MRTNQQNIDHWETLESKYQFEMLASRIAADFLGQAEKPIDLAIKDNLKIISNFFQVDRSCLAVFSEDGQNLRMAQDHTVDGAGGLKMPKHLSDMSWYAETLSKGKPIVLERIPQDLPRHLNKETQSWLKGRIKSHIGVPIIQGPSVIGALTLDSFQAPRIWPEASIEQLNRVCDLFGKIIRQKETISKFSSLFQFEKILSEISSVFANLPAENIDKYIDFGLERIGRFLNADRCDYAHYDEPGGFAEALIFSWVKKGVARLPKLENLDKLFPWTMSQILKGKSVHFSHLEDVPEEARIDKETWRRIGNKSNVNVPISIGGPIVGALSITTVREHRNWPDEIIPRLRLVGEVFSNALLRKKKEFEVTEAFEEIKKLKSQIEADCFYLQEEIKLAYDHHHMIGQSDPFNTMIYRINQIADTNSTVLISGETGTGKELVARAIHANSRQKNRPMVKVNCAALSQNLIESELFGHEKGAFTGSHKTQIGRFELANGNTLFLDEIGELPFASQAKLLRVLQEGEFERLGSSKTIKVDVRIIAATNRNLKAEVKNGRFRQDLWYRLNVFPIEVPALRDRIEDIPILADWFIQKFSKKLGKSIEKIPSNVMKSLKHYQWPGNVRELENVIERAVINSQGATLQLFAPLSSGEELSAQKAKKLTLAELERNYILQILEETRWRIYGPKGAAILLGLHPSTLRARMRKLNIR